MSQLQQDMAAFIPMAETTSGVQDQKAGETAVNGLVEMYDRTGQGIFAGTVTDVAAELAGWDKFWDDVAKSVGSAWPAKPRMSRSDAVSRPRIGTRRAPAWLRNDRLGAALLFAPGFVAYLAFMVLQILLSFYFSFFDWNGISRTMNFVGLRNFARAIQDDSFLNALRITFFFTIPGALAGNALGILFAVLVNRPGPLTNVYRAVFFFPLLISCCGDRLHLESDPQLQRYL